MASKIMAGKFSLLHKEHNSIIVGLLGGLRADSLTDQDIRYIAAFYTTGFPFPDCKVTCETIKDYNGPSKFPIRNYEEIIKVQIKK